MVFVIALALFAAALLLLTPDVRAALVAWRNACVPEGPAWTEHASSTLLLGSFEITPDRANYVLYGSPTRKTGAHELARQNPFTMDLKHTT